MFIYDASGKLAAEDATGSGQSGRRYLTADHLGSVRLETGENGAAARRLDYVPFEEETEDARTRQRLDDADRYQVSIRQLKQIHAATHPAGE